jgi:signal transduction histidine kinase/CheY-like chemotaxis protein
VIAAIYSGSVDGPATGLEVGLRTRGGAVVPVNVSLSALNDGREGPGRIVLVARDVRDQRRMERERHALERKVRQSQKLESLGVLAGGVAHDFNNLLVGMLGNATLLRERIAPESALGTLVDRIEESAQRAADLTRQMLAYSGRGRFVIEPMDLSEVAAEMRRLVAAALSKRANVRLDLAAELPAVEGDATQVRQVIMNLLTNASDALGGGDGTITLRTGVVDADSHTLSGGVLDDDLPPGRYVSVEVEDTGVGMTEAVRRRMFDPFFTTKSTGRGLGLAATLGIVRGHRGAIRVRSTPGKGTVVTVLLPASGRVRVPTAPQLPVVAIRPPRGAVLVADDEPAVLEFVADVLRTTGVEVLTARDGIECVDRFAERSGDIALVILDLTMPRLNGDETLRALRNIRTDVIVLLSSGYTEQEATSRFADEGLAGFLQKPYRARQLLARVRPLLGADA